MDELSLTPNSSKSGFGPAFPHCFDLAAKKPDYAVIGYGNTLREQLESPSSPWKIVKPNPTRIETPHGLSGTLYNVQSKTNPNLQRAFLSVGARQTIWGEGSAFLAEGILEQKPRGLIFLGSSGAPGAGDASYGSDIYVLKMDHVRDRVTLNSGDSNGRLAKGSGPNWEHRTHNAKTWDQLFVPWKNRAVMAPIMLDGFEKGQIGQPSLPKESILKMGWPSPQPYMEIQVFGPLALDDVEIFEFGASPPSGAFLQDLLSRRIKIRDGRKRPAVDWVPGNP